MRANEISNKEISIFEIYAFFTRQIKVILIIFLIVCAAGIAYSITRPTLYMSTSSVTIGKSVSLGTSTVTLLESPEVIAYKYSNIATVTPIKNTDIVNISSANKDRKQSIENVKSTIGKIIDNQKEIYQAQEKNFIKYIEFLNITDTANDKLLDILKTASKSSATQSSEVVTTELPYSGKIKKTLLLTFILALFVAFAIGGLKELIRREHENQQSVN